MSKCRLKTGCGWDKNDKRCCNDCRKKNIACSKACEVECKNIKVDNGEKRICGNCKNFKAHEPMYSDQKPTEFYCAKFSHSVDMDDTDCESWNVELQPYYKNLKVEGEVDGNIV